VSPHRWDFISDNRADFGVKRICRVLGASRAGYYRHLATEQVRTERQAEEKRTVSEIRAIHAEHQGAYGAPRVHAELRARGRRINRKRVTRLMRINHIVGRHLRKKKRTTIADRAAPPTPDLVMRDFTADTLNTRWCGDITYIAVGTTWLSPATVIDICSRKVVGWSIADHMRASLVTDAIEMAVAARGGRVHGVVFHTDRGAQYSSLCRGLPSARHPPQHGRVGSSYDNALAESFFQGLKRELLHGRRWTSKAQTAGAVPLAVVLQPAPSALRARLPHTSRVRTAPDHVTYAVTRRMKPSVHSRGSTSGVRSPCHCNTDRPVGRPGAPTATRSGDTETDISSRTAL
jgi:transposase InsO family protein